MPSDSKPSRNEDEYFARMDAELRKELRAKADAERSERLKANQNKCPRCGVTMLPQPSGSVTIDKCPQCEGVWLDKGELEILAAGKNESAGFVGSLLNILR
jgi:hypothetical protein